MNKKTRQRLKASEKAIVAFLAAFGLFVIASVLSWDNNPLHIFSQPPPPPPSPSYFDSGIPAAYWDIPRGCWQSGDSKYDFDTQAKLIALTNAYFDTKDPDMLILIAYRAEKIRAMKGVGDAADDPLVDAAYVSLLGQALDEAVRSGGLSKEKLLELERPYMTVHTPDAINPGITEITYSFGKVDIVITYTTDVSISGSETSVKHDVTLTTEAHYEAYVIYLPDWQSESADAVKALTASGVAEADIGTASTDSHYKFTDTWNSIDLTSAGLGVPYVIIDSHATTAGIGGPAFQITWIGISLLENKHIEHLILLGCNSGHVYHEDTNPAAAFAKKIENGLVLASDGTVHDVGVDTNGFLQYESRNDEAFQDIVGTDNRDNLGWIVYQYLGGNVWTFDSAVYTFTISSMMDYFDPAKFWG